MIISLLVISGLLLGGANTAQETGAMFTQHSANWLLTFTHLTVKYDQIWLITEFHI